MTRSVLVASNFGYLFHRHKFFGVDDDDDDVECPNFCRVENPQTAKRNPCIVFMDLIVALDRSGPSP